jgi:acyl-CoA synthetase (AMP-forming)/AMP-acid ligase II/aryl carrier-like protein
LTRPDSVADLLINRVAAVPDTAAILAPGRDCLAYDALRAQLLFTAASLRVRGIRRNDRVAIMTPNGPEAATAFLGVSAAATSAPLNPSYRAEEIEFYLSDLGAVALIVASSLDTPAREVARRLGVPIVELTSGARAGEFKLGDDGKSDASVAWSAFDDGMLAQPHDVALVLHTSGTTSRPKQVPLKHSNICASARHIGAALALGSEDRCLNVMPLFHIHGLMAAVLSSLTAGGSVVCTPGLKVPEFFDWLEEFRPTWYTAVPTMHQAVLATGQQLISNDTKRLDTTLRFIRSSSSALPRQTLTGLERLFDVPVIEAYGMTEASHQMTSNPLPPRARKHGSVGVAAGPEVAIMDADGTLLEAGATGEVVIRGPNVTSGYASNPAANAEAFTDGWFRTGDQGSIDADGYLVLQGRLKELINRGGEKISPVEVDEVLMDHPAVLHALAFALPHPTLGEDIAAAVVLREAGSVSERQLREFVSTRLAYFKTPRRIVFVDAIPKGATGKPQRIGLAERLGITGAANEDARARENVGARDATEEVVSVLWAEVLQCAPPGVHDDFFDAGGDSIRAAQLIGRIRDSLAVELSLMEFFDAPTVAGVASAISGQLDAVDG